MKCLIECPLSSHQFPQASALFKALDGWKPAGSRVHNRTIAALCLIVVGEVTTAREAAGVAGISERNLYRFRSSDKGKALVSFLRDLFQKDAGWRAFLRIVALAEQDKNLSVAMRANEWLAAINGVSPSKKVEVSQSGDVKSPGMLIIHPEAFEKMTPEERAALFHSS